MAHLMDRAMRHNRTSKWFIAAGMIASCIACFCGQARSDGKPYIRSDFIGFLASSDVVFEGIVLNMHSVTRTRLGGCHVAGLGPVDLLEVTVRISAVLNGTVTDSVLSVNVSLPPRYREGALVPGAPVLVDGFRNCADGMRVWANISLVGSHGELIPPANFHMWIDGFAPGQRVTLHDVESLLDAERSHFSSAQLDGASAVGIVRLQQMLRGSPPGMLWQCVPLTMVLGQPTQLPHFIRVLYPVQCATELLPGDSLLVPLGPVTRDTALVTSCPGGLLVQGGIVRGYGVPLAQIERALRLTPTGYRARSVASKN